MSLQEQQNLMARLYMDEDMRRAFLSDPAGVATPFGLSGVEIDDVAAVLPEEIVGFADSLFRKRLREVEKTLPLTRAGLGESFETFFSEYVQNTPSAREKKRVEDALGFCSYLLPKVPIAVRNGTRYEMAKIEFYSGARNLVFSRYEGKFHILIRIRNKIIRRTY